jgi:hypothetical protein
MKNEGLVDACEAFFAAGKDGDFEEAASMFETMNKLACSEGEPKEKGEGKKGSKGGPLALLIESEKE